MIGLDRMCGSRIWSTWISMKSAFWQVPEQAWRTVFNLDQPRHFGMHDPMIAPVTCAGSASIRYLLIGGRMVVENGAIPGLDIQKLRSDAARVVAHLAA